jgi:hypothetical protein
MGSKNLIPVQIQPRRYEIMRPRRLNPGGFERYDTYQIVIRGQISSQWSDWFDGFTIRLDEPGQTILTGPVVDQAALHSILKKIRDLGLPLVSLKRIDSGGEDTGN